MSNMIINHSSWLDGSVVPACGRGLAASVHVDGHLGAGFPAAMGTAGFPAAMGTAVFAGAPTRTRGTDVPVAVKATTGATFWATQGRPAWSPPTT